jgi:taurine dioxygenase
MKLSPFSPGCGVVVTKVQLADMTDSEVADLRTVFNQHGLVLFRDQLLSPEEHLSFANQFGEIVINKFFPPLEGFPNIALVIKEKDQNTNIGGGWHTDHSYDEVPAMGSILVARNLPTSGGDTHFANMYSAYEALSPGLQKTLETLSAVHSNKHLYGKDGYYSTTDLGSVLTGHDSVSDAVHPLVIRHPDSGRKVLYVNPGHTIGIVGWSIEESKVLLDYLYIHASQAQFICQFNWLPGSVAIWDNRSTWHYAQNDYQGQARLLHRITLEGAPLLAA